MKIVELKAAAEDCNAFCNKCGYIGKSEPHHIAGATGATKASCGYQAMRMMYVHAPVILKLIAVVQSVQDTMNDSTPQEVITAIKELEL